VEGAARRLRRIMMTMLVATLGLLPAVMSHAIDSDSQRPFDIIIVGGLITDLVMSIFLLPTFFITWARPTDHLPKPEEAKSVYEQIYQSGRRNRGAGNAYQEFTRKKWTL